MDAPQSKRFKALQAAGPAAGDEAVKSSIAGRRRSWLDRVFEFAGKKYRVVSLGENLAREVPSPAPAAAPTGRQ